MQSENTEASTLRKIKYQYDTGLLPRLCPSVRLIGLSSGTGRALLGEGVEEAIAHFRTKIAAQEEAGDGETSAAQALVTLLARLERHDLAIEISRAHLRDVSPIDLACPTAAQLCQLAKDYEKLREVSLERQDLLSYAAGIMQRTGRTNSAG